MEPLQAQPAGSQAPSSKIGPTKQASWIDRLSLPLAAQSAASSRQCKWGETSISPPDPLPATAHCCPFLPACRNGRLPPFHCCSCAMLHKLLSRLNNLFQDLGDTTSALLTIHLRAQCNQKRGNSLGVPACTPARFARRDQNQRGLLLLPYSSPAPSGAAPSAPAAPEPAAGSGGGFIGECCGEGTAGLDPSMAPRSEGSCCCRSPQSSILLPPALLPPPPLLSPSPPLPNTPRPPPGVPCGAPRDANPPRSGLPAKASPPAVLPPVLPKGPE